MHAPTRRPAPAAAAAARLTQAWGAAAPSQPFSDDSQGLHELSQGNLPHAPEVPRGPYNDLHCSGSSMEERAWREANRQHPGTIQVTPGWLGLQQGAQASIRCSRDLRQSPGGVRERSVCRVLDRPPLCGAHVHVHDACASWGAGTVQRPGPLLCIPAAIQIVQALLYVGA